MDLNTCFTATETAIEFQTITVWIWVLIQKETTEKINPLMDFGASPFTMPWGETIPIPYFS